MPQVTESTVIGGPVSEVWAWLRDFAAIGDWHPALPPAEIENGPADRVGCVRVFPLAGPPGDLGRARRSAAQDRVHVRRPRGGPARPLLHVHDHRPAGHRDQSHLRRVVLAVRL